MDDYFIIYHFSICHLSSYTYQEMYAEVQFSASVTNLCAIILMGMTLYIVIIGHTQVHCQVSLGT